MQLEQQKQENRNMNMRKTQNAKMEMMIHIEGGYYGTGNYV
jgi:hypothetical protein